MKRSSLLLEWSSLNNFEPFGSSKLTIFYWKYFQKLKKKIFKYNFYILQIMFRFMLRQQKLQAAFVETSKHYNTFQRNKNKIYSSFLTDWPAEGKDSKPPCVCQCDYDRLLVMLANVK